MDDVGTIASVALGFLLSLLIFSYLLGDNPLFRLATHLMVGIGTAYAAVVVIESVLVPQLFLPLRQVATGDIFSLLNDAQIVVMVLAALLLLKLSRRTAVLGNVSMAVVMGVGAAVAVGGAALGTLMPQVSATALSLSPSTAAQILPENSGVLNVLAAVVIITGTITTLLYFHFAGRPAGDDKTERAAWVRFPAQIGEVFLMIAFGSLYAGAIISSLAILAERVGYYVQWFSQLFGFG